MVTRLSRPAAARSATRIGDNLGRADRVRLEALVTLMPGDGRIRLSEALAATCPGQEREAALTAFRQFRARLATAATEAATNLTLDTDRQTRSNPEQRWCWFAGDDGAAQAAAELTAAETRIAAPRNPQDAAELTAAETRIAAPRNPQDALGKRLVRYFVSYAHVDAALKDDLLRRLHHHFDASFYELARWHDHDIEIGSGWHQAIQAAINDCDFGLLLVSPAFLASRYIGAHELPQFVDSGAPGPSVRKRAAPVLLKPVRFDGTMDLKGLQPLQVFSDAARSYQDMRGNVQKDAFADRLFGKLVQVLGSKPTSSMPNGALPAEPIKTPARNLDRLLRDLVEEHWSFRAKQDAYPASQVKLEATADGERRDALAYLREWACEPSAPRYCALLGEYGMGKTTTSMAFARELLVAREKAPSLPLPIYLDLRHLGDLAKGEPTLGAIIDAVVRRSWQSGAVEAPLGADDVIRLVQEEGAIAIFDGLDEVLVHLSPAAGQRFTRELFRILPPALFREAGDRPATGRPGRVLVTCRTHYFRTLREQKTHLTAEGRDGVRAEDYRVFVLLPFTPDQQRNYLQQSLPGEDIDRVLATIAAVHNLPELAERPYTLSLIAENFVEIERWKLAGRRVTGVMLYRHMVLSWLERDSGKHQFTPDHKCQLMEYFAAALWRSGRRAWSIGDVEQWLIDFLRERPDLAAHYDGRDRELLKEDLRTATFLVREGEDQFRFAHISLLEFFLAGYLHRALAAGRIGDWRLPQPSRETFDFLGQLLDDDGGDAALTGLRAMRDSYRPGISENAFDYVLLAHDRDYPAPSAAGFRLEGADLSRRQIVGRGGRPPLNLRGASLRGTRLWEAAFRHVDISGTDFGDADLARAELIDARAGRANFTGAALAGAVFRSVDLSAADFSAARLYRTRFLDCHLAGVAGVDTAASAALFALCQPASRNTPPPGGAARLAVLQGHQGVVRACAWAPDGAALASAGSDGSVRLWDPASGECRAVLQGHQGGVWACAWAPDGAALASAGSDGSVRLWDPASGECRAVLQGHQGGVLACAWAPDGAALASAGSDGSVRLWDPASGECRAVLQGHQGGVWACAWAPDGAALASAGSDGSVRLWDPASGECRAVLQGHQGGVLACAWAPDGAALASAGDDGSVRLWDPASGECRAVLQGHQGGVLACAWAPDGAALASAGDDGSVRLWDPASGECRAVLQGHQGGVWACAWAPDGAALASAGSDGSVRLWDPASGECRAVLQGHQGGVLACAWAPDGAALASAGDDGSVRLWDPASGECRAVLQGHQGGVWACAWAPDGAALASAGSDGSVRLWDPASGECRAVLQGHQGWVLACAWAPDGAALASAGSDGSVRLWDPASGECRAVLQGHQGGVWACAWAPDGTALASAGSDGSVRLWDPASGECRAVLQGHQGGVWACAWAPDGAALASAGSDGSVRLWDPASGECRAVLQGHQGWVLACAWAPDGAALASAGSDGSVRLWDPASGECRAVLQGHQGGVLACAWAPDGAALASAGSDGSVRLWDPASGAELRRWQIAADGAWAALDPAANRIRLVSGEAWRWLVWLAADANGVLQPYPAEIFGPLPHASPPAGQIVPLRASSTTK